MRRSIVLLFVILCASQGVANYVENQAYEIVQPDGSKFMAYITGDEYYHRVHDKAGFTILLQPGTGYAVYAVPGLDGIMPSSHIAGRVDPSLLGIRPGLMPQEAPVRARFEEEQRLRQIYRANPIGTINSIVAFVRFEEQDEFPTSKTYSQYSDMFNLMDTASLKDYYNEVSSGQLTINSFLYPGPNGSGQVVSILVPWERGYFSPYIEDVNDIGYPEGEGGPRKRELFEYVVDQLDTMVPNDLNIDMDNDGRVDGVTLIVCGPTDAWGDLLWPTSNSSGTPFHAINGKDVHSVILNFQQSLGISVICHEMGHQIGAPDFYHYHEWEPWHSIHPVSTWCLMASDRAQHWLTHNKWKYGHWFDAIPTLTATANPTTYTISSVNESPYSCYKIISAVPDQYYMVEYRKKAGLYENNLDGSGLIVYRVTTGINGNAGGPPDEIYVYRPNGTLTENGQPGNAFFSQESGRTEIFNGSNPSPWLYADTLSTIAGDIVITNVGSSAGNSISFTINTIAPNTWTGEINESWTNAWNWTQGVPGSSDDVIIPSGCAQYPNLNGGGTGSCKKLTLANGGIIKVGPGTLNVHGTAHLSGQIQLCASAGTVDFKGHTNSYSGSSIIDSAAGMLKFNGSWKVDSGCTINLDQSTVSFYGAEDAELQCDALVNLKHAYVSKIYNKAVYYQSSLARLQVNGTFSLAAGGGFVQNADSDLQIAGSMLGSGYFRQEAGTLKAIGSTAQTISMSGSSYINNLWINGSAQLNLQSALNIRGDVSVSGTINAGGYAMTVWGSWTGTGTLNGTDNRVIFAGSGISEVQQLDAQILELAKTGSGTLLLGTGKVVSCQQYDWTSGRIIVSGGSFSASDLYDPHIAGTFTLSAGAINLAQDGDNSLDINADITITGGTFTIVGGSRCNLAASRSVNFTMGGGVLELGIRGMVYESGCYALTSNLYGGTIRTAGSLLITRGGFVMTGGTVEPFGGLNSSVIVNAPSRIHHLNVAKSPSNTVYINGNTVVGGNATITTGRLEIQDCTLGIAGNLTITGTLAMNSVADIVNVEGSVIWSSASTCDIVSGTLAIKGNMNVNNSTSFTMGDASILKFYGTSPSALSTGLSTLTLGNILVQKTGSSCTLDPTGMIKLFYANDVVVYGGSTFNPYNNAMIVEGKIDIWEGGCLTVNNNAEISAYNFYCSGLYNQSNGLVYVNNNYIQYATGTNQITGGTFRIDTPYGGSHYSFAGTTTLSGGNFQITNNGIQFGIGSSFNMSGSGTLKLGWGLRALSESVFQASSGTVQFIGERSSNINLAAGNYLPNIVIDKAGSTGAVYLLTDLTVKKSCTVQNGRLYVNERTLTVEQDIVIQGGDLYAYNSTDHIRFGGSWTNNASPENFIEGSGLVTFIGGGLTTTIGSPETFNHLRIDSSPSARLILAADMTLSINADLEISSGQLRILDGSHLNVLGNMSISGANSVVDLDFNRTVDPTDTHIHGNLLINGGILKSQTTNAAIALDTFLIDGDLAMTGGELDVRRAAMLVHGNFSTTATSLFKTREGTFVNDAPYTGTWQIANCAWTTNGSTIEFPNKGLQFVSGAQWVTDGFSVIRIGRGFYAVSDDAFDPGNGTIEFIGSVQANINMGANNTLPSVTINKPGSMLVLSTPAIVTGSITITSGNFNSNGHALTIGGDWVNNVGSSGYTSGTSEVVFRDQYAYLPLHSLIGAQTFHKVTVDYPLSTQYLNSSGNSTVQNLLNVVSGGLRVNGTLQINSDVSIAQNAYIEVTGGDFYLAGNLSDSNMTYSGSNPKLGLINASGSVILNGSGNQTIAVGYAEIGLNNLFLIKSSGIFQPAKPVNLKGNATITSGTWGYGASGLTHKIGGNLNIASGGIWNDNTGTVSFVGTGNGVLSNSGTASFKNLHIDKSSSRTTFVSLSLGSNIALNTSGTITIDGGCLDLGAYSLQTKGSVNVNSDGKLAIGPGGILTMYSSSSLSVNSGGVLETLGTSEAQALITSLSGTYNLEVNSGATLSSEWTIFEYPGSNGIRINSGALVDPTHALHHCTFRFGTSGGPLLAIDNAQTFQIQDARFPSGGSQTFNVSKTLAQGEVSFNGESGGFAGTGHENDPFGRVNWSSDVPEIQVNPGAFAFGDVTWMSTSSQYMVIANPGSAILRGDIHMPSGFSVSFVGTRTAEARELIPEAKSEQEFSRNDMGFSYLPGTSGIYMITFAPQEPIPYSGYMVVTHNADQPAFNLLCSGNGVGAKLFLDNTQLQFDLLPGQSGSILTNLTDAGTDSLSYFGYVNYMRDRDVILETGFEDAMPPAGWNETPVSGTAGDWLRYSSTVHPSGNPPSSGSWLGYFNSYTSNVGNSSRLESPVLDLSLKTSVMLSLWMFHDSGYDTRDDRIQVQVSIAGGAWTDVGAPISRYNGQWGWHQHYVDLSSVNHAANVRVGLLGISAYGNDIHIDDLSITGTTQLPSNWITLNGGASVSGLIFPDDPAVPITVSVDTTGIPQGFYMNQLVFMSNDPVYPFYALPLMVRIGVPAYETSPATLEFGSLQVGMVSMLGFSVESTGSIGLSGTVTTPAGYEIITIPGPRGRSDLSGRPEEGLRNQTSFYLYPGESRDFMVGFGPMEAQSYDGQIIISTNTGTDTYVDVTGEGISQPQVNTISVTDIQAASAICHAELSSTGNLLISARGIVYNTWGDPDLDDGNVLLSEGQGGGFDLSLSGLVHSSTYYVKAFATNTLGTVYGEELSFSTLTPQLSLSTHVLPDFGHVPIGTTSAPASFTISGEHLVDMVMMSSHSGFTISLNQSSGYDSLLLLYPTAETLPETTVYVRFTPPSTGAYTEVITPLSVGTAAGEIALSGLGVTIPQVHISIPFNITSSSAEIGGLVQSDGLSPVTACGICWSLNPSPTVSDWHSTLMYQPDWYYSLMEGLDSGTSYYARAYATNVAGTAYSSQSVFSTHFLPQISVLPAELPSFGEALVGSVTPAAQMTIQGSILGDELTLSVGGNYGLSLSSRDGGRVFTQTIQIPAVDSLIAPTSVYVRFQPQSGGNLDDLILCQAEGVEDLLIPVYGTGIGLPTLSTTPASNLASYSATVGGNILADGFSAINACGVCFDTSPGVDLDGPHTSNSALQGEFIDYLLALLPDTSYYIRAYATNAAGTAYGEELSFATPADLIAAPQHLRISIAGPNVLLEWDPVLDAEYYKVYALDFYTTSSETWPLPQICVDTSLSMSITELGARKFFFVIACKE